MIYSKDKKKLNNTKEKANSNTNLTWLLGYSLAKKIKGWTTNNKT